MGRKVVAVLLALHVFPIFGIIVMRSVGGLAIVMMSAFDIATSLPDWLLWSLDVALVAFALVASGFVTWKVYRWALGAPPSEQQVSG